MKVCSKCQEAKDVSEFHNEKAAPDGLHRWCRPCASARRKEYHAKNRERALEQMKDWKKNNYEYSDNPLRIKYWTVEEKAQAGREKSKRYREANLEKSRLAGRNKASRRKAAKSSTLVDDPRLRHAFEALCLVYGERCMISGCQTGEVLHLDHIVPLVKQGSHSFDNLQLLCRFHNLSKRDRNAVDHRPFTCSNADVDTALEVMKWL